MWKKQSYYSSWCLGQLSKTKSGIWAGSVSIRIKNSNEILSEFCKVPQPHKEHLLLVPTRISAVCLDLNSVGPAPCPYLSAYGSHTPRFPWTAFSAFNGILFLSTSFPYSFLFPSFSLLFYFIMMVKFNKHLPTQTLSNKMIMTLVDFTSDFWK